MNKTKIWYETNAEEYIEESNKFNMSKFYKFIDKEISYINNPKILDFGFGSGRDILYLREKYPNIYGYDICEKFIEHANKLDLNICTSITDDFDLIYSVGVMNHMDKDGRISFFNKVKEGLSKNNGKLILSFFEDGRISEDEREFYVVTKEDIINESGLEILNEIEIKDKRKIRWTTISLSLPSIEKVKKVKKTYTREENSKYVASWSGGKDSTFMVDQLLRNGDPLDLVLFSNTGYEFPEMYAYIEKMKNYWESKYDVEIVLLNAGENGRKIWSKWAEGPISRGPNKGIPRGFPFSIGMSWCTRELKIVPAQKYIKSKYPEQKIFSYVGIGYDEPKRISDDENLLYPMYDWKLTERDAQEILVAREMHNPLYNYFSRTGCYLCPKQSLKSLFKLWKYFPELWQELKTMEEHYNSINAFEVRIHSMSTKELEDKFLLYIEKGKTPENNMEDEIPIGCFCK